jgi:hypothetical protein
MGRGEVFDIGHGSVSTIDVTPEEVLDLEPQPQSDEPVNLYSGTPPTWE